MTSNIVTTTTATIEKQICEELKTRLKLNDTVEAVYWLDQVIGEENSVVDFLANQIAAMIDTPINVKIPKAENQ